MAIRNAVDELPVNASRRLANEASLVSMAKQHARAQHEPGARKLYRRRYARAARVEARRYCRRILAEV